MNEKIVGTTDRFLTFSLGGEHFAMPLLQVQEVIALTEVTPVPQMPKYFLGIMNLRGQVVTIMDLRTKLGIKPAEDQETVVIICDMAPVCVGIVVDSVNSVFAVNPKQISTAPEMMGSKLDSIIGVYRDEKNLILLLDIAKTLNQGDQVLAQKIQTQRPALKAA